jgi:hypothetical protein
VRRQGCAVVLVGRGRGTLPGRVVE